MTCNVGYFDGPLVGRGNKRKHAPSIGDGFWIEERTQGALRCWTYTFQDKEDAIGTPLFELTDSDRVLWESLSEAERDRVIATVDENRVP